MSDNTVTIGMDTPMALLTPRQLFEMLGEWQAQQRVSPAESDTPKRWYVNSMNELAEILGTSVSTLYRMKSNGILDDCISQYGKWMVIDVEKVIEKFRLSNIKTRRYTKRMQCLKQ